MITDRVERAQEWLRRRGWLRMARYSAGSAVATGISQVVFLALYALGAGPRVSSVLAYLVGIVPNYQLSRRWAWQRRGRSSWLREVLPYLVVVGTSLVLVTLGTDLAEGWITGLELTRPAEVVAVTLAFAAVNGVMFVTKYLVYDRWLFGDRSRSRSQVPTSTRA